MRSLPPHPETMIANAIMEYMDMDDDLVDDLVTSIIIDLRAGFIFDRLIDIVRRYINDDWIPTSIATRIWHNSTGDDDYDFGTKYFGFSVDNLSNGLQTLPWRRIDTTTLENIALAIRDPYRSFTYSKFYNELSPILEDNSHKDIIISVIWMMGGLEPPQYQTQDQDQDQDQDQTPPPARQAPPPARQPQWQEPQIRVDPGRIQTQLQRQDMERALYVANESDESREAYYTQMFGPSYASWTFFNTIMQDDMTINEYISEDLDNIVFVIDGATPVIFASTRSAIRNKLALYDCEDRKKKYLSLTNIGYHGIGAANYDAVKTAVINSNYQIYSLRQRGNTNKLMSHGTMYYGESGAHCEEGSQMPYYQIYIPPL